jgi:zinc protease
MVGKNISVSGPRVSGHGGAIASDSITLTVSGSPQDLEAGMQLAHLLLREPRIESAAFEQFKTQKRQTIQEAASNPILAGMRLLSGAPYPQDVARTQPVSLEQLDRISLDAAQAWLDKLVHESPIEVVVVGDVGLDTAMPLIRRYLGSLPSRDPVTRELFADRRELPQPTEPRTIAKEIATTTPQAFVMSGFYGPDETNLADLRPMNVATRILSTRMIKEIREDAQLVYSISAMLRSGRTYPGFGMVMAAAPTEPAKVDALTGKVAEMYRAMAEKGITPGELDTAKKQIANIMEEQMRSRGFWLSQLSRMTFRGIALDDIVTAPAAYEAVTAAQVQATFAKYFQTRPSLIVTVTPVDEETP